MADLQRWIEGLQRRIIRLRFRLFGRHRLERVVLETLDGHPILVLPEVFHPKLFFSSEFLIRFLDSRWVPAGSQVLDLGTGSGVAALVAARWASRVVAVDINPAAVRCARINVLLNEVEDRVEVREGDLFGAVAGERFDVILFNPPFWRGVPQSRFDRAFRSRDTPQRLAGCLPSHLLPGGYALIVLSSRGQSGVFLEAFQARGIAAECVTEQKRAGEILRLFCLRAS